MTEQARSQGSRVNYQLATEVKQVPVGYKQTEAGVIPSDWEVRLLEQLVAYRNGAAHENCIDDSGDYVVVNSKFISTEGLTRKGSKECRQPAYQSEILMVMSDVPNGRAIAKCYWVESNDIYTVNQRICALKCTDIESRFLFYKLNRNPFYLAFDDGAKQTNLRRQDVLDCPIPVPTKQEQTAIANALSDVDALISELEKLIAKKQAIKTATMQQLLTGKIRLTSGELIMDNGERKTHYQLSTVNSQFVKHSELGEIPEDWEVKSLGQIATVKSGGTPSTNNKDFWDGDIYWCTPTDITALKGRKYLSNTSRKITEIGVVKSSAEILPAGSIVMTSRATIGECAITNVEMTTNQGFKNLICGPESDNEFLFYLISSLKERLVALCSGSTFLEISIKQVRDFLVAVPTKEEQTAIASILSDMDAEIQALEQRLGKTRHIKQGMMQELLTGKTRLIKGETRD